MLANESDGCQPLVLAAYYRGRQTMIRPAMMRDKIGKKRASSIFQVIRLLERTRFCVEERLSMLALEWPESQQYEQTAGRRHR